MSFKLSVAGASVLALGVGMGASPVSANPFCPEAADFMERFCGRDHLSSRTREQCHQLERTSNALCEEFDIVYASMSAEGPALDRLRQDYLVMPIEAAVGQFTLSHVAIGPIDLDDPDVVALLKAAYEAGSTVAIANATQADADDFHGLIRGGSGGASCDAEQIALYGLQQTTARRPRQDSIYCVASAADLDAEHPARQWLRERFPAKPPTAPESEPERELSAALASGDVNLNSLAKQIHCSQLFKGDLVPGISATEQVDLFVSGLRDFGGNEDYYLVSFPVGIQFGISASSYEIQLEVPAPEQTVDGQSSPLPGTEVL